MWRSSGRGCAVSPSAPASCAIRPKRNTSGTPVRRELRKSAILLRLTLRRGMAASLHPQPYSGEADGNRTMVAALGLFRHGHLLFRSLRTERISLIGETEFGAPQVATLQPNVLISSQKPLCSAADGVALHAARVGGGFEHGAFWGRLAGAARETAFGPR